MNLFAVVDLWLDARIADLDLCSERHPENVEIHDARRRELHLMRDFFDNVRRNP